MPARFNIKMQRLILLALIPALSLITLVAGAWLYRSLYQVIIEGFDRKLYALSTTTASFIDGERLLTVIEPYEVRGLAWDADEEVLYGVDAIRWALVTIDTEIGGATVIGPIGFDGIADLAFDPETRVLYGISSTSEQLIRIDPQTGAGAPVMRIPVPAQGLTWDGRRLLASGAEGLAIYPDTEEIHRYPLGIPDITGLAYDAETDTLYGVRGAEGILVTIDSISGAVDERGLLIPEGHAFGEVDYGEEAGELPAFGLSLNPSESVLYAAADRLMILDPETGAGELDVWLARNYCNPASETFESFAAPMRAILNDKEVTYLYTFKLGGRKDILYLVDATPGDDWAPIGYEEDLPPQNMEGLVRAVEKGVPFISDVLYFELWGLLKVAAAPVYDAEGEVRALAGVDINIDLIRTKTRVALFQVLGFGAVSLMLAGVVSLWVTRRLTRPINLLKYGALRIAAGQYAHPIEIKDPSELRELAASLNGIGETLQKTIRDMAKTSERMEEGRQRSELAKTLPNFSPIATEEDGHLAARWLGNRPHCADSSGCLYGRGLALHWLGHRDEDLLLAVKRRSDLALALRGWLHQADTPHVLMDQVDRLFRADVSAYVVCDPREGTVLVSARKPITLCTISEDKSPQAISVPTGRKSMRLEPGESLVLLSSDPKGDWIEKLAAERFPAEERSDHAGKLADHLENRLQSHTISELIHHTGLLTVVTRTRAS